MSGSYRAALLTRWSRRDRLAVAVVAFVVAFLTATVLLFTAFNAQVLGLAASYDAGATVAPEAEVGSGEARLVVTTAEVRADGAPPGRSTVAGLSSQVTVTTDRGAVRLAPPPTGATVGQQQPSDRVRLVGDAATETVRTGVRSTTLLPPTWYLTDAATAERLGGGTAYVVRTGADQPRVPDAGVPLRGVFPFFLLGTGATLTVLRVVTLVASVLAAVTVFSVSRMAVLDRRRTVRVARATGATGRALAGLFALRGALLALVGTALGYGVGVIAPRLAVNAAVFAGVPATLDLAVSMDALTVLLPGYAAVVGVGAGAGLAASYGLVTGPPAAVGDAVGPPSTPRRRSRSGGRIRLRPRVLDWRPVVPTAATLTVFVAIGLVLAAGVGALGPVVAGGETVVEPGSAHPVASTVPTGYADALRATGTDASPEILAFSVHDGEAFVTRGVDYGSFASVSSAGLARGRAPDGPGEAVVGASLADRLNVGPGEDILLGGSTRAALTRVTVVGVFTAPGGVDDQLLVSLPTARHLTGKPAGTVQFVRTDGLTATERESGPIVVELSAPGTAIAGETVSVEATVLNPGDARAETVTASLGNVTRTTRVDLGAFDRSTVRFDLPVGEPGTATLTVGNRTRTLTVQSPDALVLTGLPERAPPGSEPRVLVRTAAGSPVANATVVVGNRTVRTDRDGRVRLPLNATGEREVVVRAGNRSVRRTVTVAAGTDRRPVVSLSVSPSDPSVLSTPTVTASLQNPWNRTLVRTVTLSGADRATKRTVRLAPGDRATVRLPLGRLAPGDLSATAAVNGTTVARQGITVSGDDRLAAALATGGRTGGSGIGQAIASVVGSLQVLAGTVLALAGVTVVGSVTAVFASAVRARRRTLGIHRATGATPRRIRRLVVGDALRLGAVAAAIGLALGTGLAVALDRLGLLTLYGIRLAISPSPRLLGGLALAALALVAVAAGLATRSVTVPEPGSLLTQPGAGGRNEGSDGSRGDQP